MTSHVHLIIGRRGRENLSFMNDTFQSIVKDKPDEELLLMVYQFDQWDVAMLHSVEVELKRRNILPANIEERRQQIIKEEDERLSKGTAASIGGQIFGWLGVAGLFGLIIGYNYSFSKVYSIYTRKKYYRYDEDSRDNGRYIFYTSVIVHSLGVCYILYTAFFSKYRI